MSQAKGKLPAPTDTAVSASLDTVIDWFRTASPYINAHRGKTLVLALPGKWLRSDLLPTLTHDLTLLSHLGLRLVVCFGLRTQVDEALARGSYPSAIVAGRRVTDEQALKAIIESAGITRNTLESQLSMGLPNTPMAGARLSVSSGNYVTAQPFGVHDGVDFQHTGSVREIHSSAITALLDAGHLVLLPPLGYSLTGDVFNVTVNELAAEVAIALTADKLVYLVDDLPTDESGQLLRQASAPRLEQLQSTTRPGEADNPGLKSNSDSELDSVVPQAVRACRNGVERVHLLNNDDRNGLLSELFTRDGSGTMVTANRWEHIRPASIQDVRGIIELIEPLQANGTLVNRSREQLEIDIAHFVVSERDGMVVACAAMYPDDALSSVEIACIATHPRYRGEGRADQLLSHLEDLASQRGFSLARVLSTRTGHWFVERGYREKNPDELPATRLASYNQQRNSKVYEKSLV
ncbi:MAG: amino-acid N-acetyltransferase [Granulosicoccus sp.]